MSAGAVNDGKKKLLKHRDRRADATPVIVSIAVERPALGVLNPLGWNPLIAFFPTFPNVHAGSLRFDLNSNLPPHRQFKAEDLYPE